MSCTSAYKKESSEAFRRFAQNKKDTPSISDLLRNPDTYVFQRLLRYYVDPDSSWYRAGYELRFSKNTGKLSLQLVDYGNIPVPEIRAMLKRSLYHALEEQKKWRITR
jgi:hypothetical protein